MKTNFELTPEETAQAIRKAMKDKGLPIDDEAEVGFIAEMERDKLKNVRAVVKGEFIDGETGPAKPLELRTGIKRKD